MAILNGIIKKLNGSAGSLTFKTVNGQTVVSEKVTNVKNSRTSGQQRQRMKWVNIIHMYSGISPLLKNGFEKKMATQSDYNIFVRLNNQATPVYLTKAMADGGGCVAAPYQITQGSLPSIVVTGSGENAKTDISLGSLTISETTTVKEFSNAVVENNSDYSYGDQISFYDILQKVNAETEIPYCQFAGSYVILDKDSTVLLWDQVNKAGFASVSGVLGHGDDEGDGVFAWVHSSYESGKTKVSSQFLIDNNALLDTYTSEDAYAAAVDSYGGINTVFLNPDGSTVSSSSQSSGGTAGTNVQVPSGDSTTTTYTVSLAASPSNGGTVSGAGSYSAGSSASIVATPASGYKFSKWSDNDTNASRSVTVNSNLSLTATFVQDSGGSNDDDEEIVTP